MEKRVQQNNNCNEHLLAKDKENYTPVQHSYFISCLYKLEFRKIKGNLADQKALKFLRYNQERLPPW